MTDHHSLQHLATTKLQHSRLVRWMNFLLDCDYTILYTPGQDNVVADCLSRRDDYGTGWWLDILLPHLQARQARYQDKAVGITSTPSSHLVNIVSATHVVVPSYAAVVAGSSSSHTPTPSIVRVFNFHALQNHTTEVVVLVRCVLIQLTNLPAAC